MNTPSLPQPGCYLGQPAHLRPSPACGQLIVELTMCPCVSHIDQFLPHPTSAFPLSSLLSPLIVHPSPSPPFINILLLLGVPEMHVCYGTGTMRAAGCIFLCYWRSSSLCCENIQSYHLPTLWCFQSVMLAGQKEPFSPALDQSSFLCH